jgi:hypothetical protein
MVQMSDFPKSERYQASIDERKLVADRSVAKARAAEMKLRRERDAILALTEHEMNRLATLAKTQRLRAERLARIADVQPKKPAVSVKSASRARRSKQA